MRGFFAILILMLTTSAYAQNQETPAGDPIQERLDKIILALSSKTPDRTVLKELEKTNRVLGYDEKVEAAVLSTVLDELKAIKNQLINRAELKQISTNVANGGALDKSASGD